MPPGRRLAEHDDRLAVGQVTLLDGPSADGDAQRLEVAGRHGARSRHDRRFTGLGRASFDLELLAPAQLAGEGQAGGHRPHAAHARDGRDPSFELLVEGEGGRVSIVTRGRQADPEREGLPLVESGPHGAKLAEGAQQEPRAHEEDEGQGDLRGHQDIAPPQSAATGRGAAVVVTKGQHGLPTPA